MTDQFKSDLIAHGVDYNDALDRCADDESLFELLLDMYRKDESYELMLQYIAENNAKEAFDCAHTLKGISSNIGLNRVLEHLIPIVEALRVHNIEGAKPHLSDFKKEYLEICTVIGTHIESCD